MMTRSFVLRSMLLAAAAVAAAACSVPTSGDSTAATSDELRGPGALATDARTPELPDLDVLEDANVSLLDGIREAEKSGPVIEAKFELDDAKQLSLSVYPAGKAVDVDAERQVFRELSGDPTKAPFAGALETFSDEEHLTRSSRDLTLVQLSTRKLSDVVADAQSSGTVYWAVPTMRAGRAGYGVYLRTACGQTQYRFVDGGGSRAHTVANPQDLGTGPGAKATDARSPELGDDLSVLATAKVKMSDALAQVEAEHGATIEAKYEIGDDGKLSLSIYPVGKGLATDAERNTFAEVAGDPTAATYVGTKTTFAVPDAEHLTRSARDLTLVQAAGFGLRDAVRAAERALPGGFVYWAVPTIRDTRAGYGVYVLGKDGKAHYFFLA